MKRIFSIFAFFIFVIPFVASAATSCPVSGNGIVCPYGRQLCGNVCKLPSDFNNGNCNANQTFSCGSCSCSCQPGFFDCDGNPANGCELNPSKRGTACTTTSGKVGTFADDCGATCQETITYIKLGPDPTDTTQENKNINNPAIGVDQPYSSTGELLKITKGAARDGMFVVGNTGNLIMGKQGRAEYGVSVPIQAASIIQTFVSPDNAKPLLLFNDSETNSKLFEIAKDGSLPIGLTVGTGNIGTASAGILEKVSRTATTDPLLIKKDFLDALKLDLLRLDNDGNLTVGDPVNGNGSLKANAIYSRTTGADNIWVGDNNDTLVVQGNIGIGTLNPPTQKLYVYSTTSADGIAIDGTTNPALRLMNSGVLKAFVALSTGAGAYSMDALANDLVIRTEAGSQKILFNTNGGAAGSSLAINNGNVGIGTLGSNEKLEVNGNVRLSSGTARTISIASRTSGGGDSLTVQSGGGVGSFSAGGNLNLGAGSVSGLNSLGGSVFIYPGAGVTNGNIILGHNGSNAVGNVSLGTMTSEAKLTIGGSIVGAYRNWMVNGITVGKEGDNDGAYFGIKNEGVNRQDTVIAWGDDAEETLKFLYTGSGGPANGLEAMRIDSAGRVGIGMGGVNLPSAYKLTVGGDVFVTGNIVSSATLSGPNMGRTSCQLIDSAVNGGQAYCPAGYYVAGLQNNAGNNSIIDQLICCHL